MGFSKNKNTQAVHDRAYKSPEIDEIITCMNTMLAQSTEDFTEDNGTWEGQ